MRRTVLIKRKTESTVKTKYGEKQKISLLCPSKDGDLWIGVWKSAEADTWAEGDEVELDITTSEGKDGKVYYNGKPIIPNYAKLQVELLEQILGALRNGNMPKADSRPAVDPAEEQYGEMLPPPEEDGEVPF